MTIPNLSESIIRHHSNSKSFDRGEGYYRHGAVVDLCQRGNQIQANVEGNAPEPYAIHIMFDGGGITQASCTCPYGYEFDGWCKHIIATALMCLRQPDRIHQRPSLNELLTPLDLAQLQKLLEALVDDQPSLINTIDRIVGRITRTQPTASTRPKRQTAINPDPYRYQAKQVIRNTLHYWEYGDDDYNSFENEFSDLVDQAQAFTDQGDGNNALVILEAITQTCADNWGEIADYGGDGEQVVQLLDPAWAEALLSAELPSGEAVQIQLNLEAWERPLSGCFEMSAEALRQGWDDPGLVAVLQGETTELWDDRPPDYAGSLAQIRLRILARQTRYDEYLRLAWAEGQIQEYLIMLARLDRVEEVMVARDHLTYANEALEVAKVLREQGALTQALAIAQQGLTLPKLDRWLSSWQSIPPITSPQMGTYELADWTSELAEGLGNRADALSARIEAFKLEPSFRDYQKVEALAGENWPTLKLESLEFLREQRNWSVVDAQVTIFLHEDLIDDAIAAVDSYGRHHLLSQVMTAAISHRPDWVIQSARRQAEDIMDKGKSDAYQAAADWLAKAREAYLHCDRLAEWRQYRAQIMTKHARKYKLMGLLKQRHLE
jgi:uncharacterized Zn finger protein